jgi:hypothetical protein
MRLRFPRRVRRHACDPQWFEPSPLVWFEVILAEIRAARRGLRP